MRGVKVWSENSNNIKVIFSTRAKYLASGQNAKYRTPHKGSNKGAKFSTSKKSVIKKTRCYVIIHHHVPGICQGIEFPI
jgi:hypothetical protein